MPIATFLHGVEVVEVPSATQPVAINQQGVIGLIGTADSADPAAFPLNVPVLLNSQPQLAQKLGTVGTLLSAVDTLYQEGAGAIVIVRVASALDQPTQWANVVGAPVGNTGVYAFTTARATVGLKPTILIAPGFTSPRAAGPTAGTFAANPVVTALIAVAERLKAVVYADAPSTSYADALAWRTDFGSDRLVAFWPALLCWNSATASYQTTPASIANAGLTARVVAQYGFWYSPSNHLFRSVGGMAIAVDFALGDATCLANTLNQNDIATAINMMVSTGVAQGGWRRWGNRSVASDANWTFEVVRRVEDAVYEALDEATLWAVDKPPSAQLLKDMTERANDFFKFGKATGFLVGGRCWLDPELNPPAQLASGVWNWSIDPEAPAPMEHIVYTASRNQSYYSGLVQSLAALVAQGTTGA